MQTVMLFLDCFFHENPDFSDLANGPEVFKETIKEDFTGNKSLTIHHLDKSQFVCSKLFHQSGDLSNNSQFSMRIREIMDLICH